MTESLATRVAALESAVQSLQERAEPSVGTGSPQTRPAGSLVDTDSLWMLDELRRRYSDEVVAFAGTATVGKGEAAWQWGVPTEQLREADWSGAAPVFEALAHPVRLHLLQRVLNGTTATSGLAADDRLGTTGQLHHHLRVLVGAGWLSSVGRGEWAVPPHRAIPLLTAVLTATSR